MLPVCAGAGTALSLRRGCAHSSSYPCVPPSLQMQWLKTTATLLHHTILWPGIQAGLSWLILMLQTVSTGVTGSDSVGSWSDLQGPRQLHVCAGRAARLGPARSPSLSPWPLQHHGQQQKVDMATC